MPTEPTDSWGPVGGVVARWLTEALAPAPSGVVAVLITLGALSLGGLAWIISTRLHGLLSDPPEDHAG